VGHLLRSVIAFCKVKALVVSDLSWMWALACAQVGIGSIMCLPISQDGEENLACLCQSKLSLLDNVQQISSVEPGTATYDILLVELGVVDLPYLDLLVLLL
jgi:hypothetical protein